MESDVMTSFLPYLSIERCLKKGTMFERLEKFEILKKPHKPQKNYYIKQKKK
jgi:hypothetical protein